jgi:Flp pilus assembly pilin Flp
MRRQYPKQKAQSVVEYGLVIALITGVLLVMQVYIRRGMQGRLKDVSDYTVREISRQVPGAAAQQFEPGYRGYDKEVWQDTTLNRNLSQPGREIKEYERHDSGYSTQIDE